MCVCVCVCVCVMFGRAMNVKEKQTLSLRIQVTFQKVILAEDNKPSDGQECG